MFTVGGRPTFRPRHACLASVSAARPFHPLGTPGQRQCGAAIPPPGTPAWPGSVRRGHSTPGHTLAVARVSAVRPFDSHNVTSVLFRLNYFWKLKDILKSAAWPEGPSRRRP